MTYREIEKLAFERYPFSKTLQEDADGNYTIDDPIKYKEFNAFITGFNSCLILFDRYKRQVEPLKLIEQLSEKHPEMMTYFAQVAKRLAEAEEIK